MGAKPHRTRGSFWCPQCGNKVTAARAVGPGSGVASSPVCLDLNWARSACVSSRAFPPFSTYCQFLLSVSSLPCWVLSASHCGLPSWEGRGWLSGSPPGPLCLRVVRAEQAEQRDASRVGFGKHVFFCACGMGVGHGGGCLPLFT